MGANKADNGFTTSKDHEDVKRFLQSLEQYGLLGKCANSMEPVGVEGPFVTIVTPKDTTSAQIGIPLDLVGLARQPAGRENKLTMLVLHETAHRILESRHGLEASEDDLLGMAAMALFKPRQMDPIQHEISADGTRQWPSQEKIAQRLLAKRDERAQWVTPGLTAEAKSYKK